jgi:hypothetical protein
MVTVGTVIRANANNGVIFVNVQNGFEIEELHDVRVVNKQNNQAILYNSSSGLWENRVINTGDISGLYDFIISTEEEFFTEAEADARYVNLYSGQNISGIKNFYNRPTVNGSGVMLLAEVEPLPTTIVYQTGDQNISGIKNFESNPQFNGVNLSTESYSIAIAIALG